VVIKRLRVFALAGVVAGAALLVLAGPASAHVTISAPGATRGGSDQVITFRVPVEQDADTVGLRLALPTKTPIASVEVQAIPGWTHTEQTTKLAQPIHTDDGDITDAVSEIDWTAKPGQGLKPGEFGVFTIIAGQLPDAPSLAFKVIQIYSNGRSVAWIETAAPGNTAELEHPAPTLQLAAKAGATPSVSVSVAPAATSKSSNTGPIVLSIVALVVSAAALGLGVVTRARGERT
jgi:periplasmic copper chaperone A